MEQLLFTLNAILPIILPILLGYGLKRLHFFSEQFLTEANKLVFRILIPILLFSNLYLSDLSKINWGFVGYSAGAILALFFIGMIVVLFIPNRKQKGVILQAVFRSNYAIIGIPLATALGGEDAGQMAAVVAAISVPLFNILAVVALSIYDHEEGKKISVKNILFKIITNPLIIGVACGLVVCGINMCINLTGANVKEFLNSYVKFIPDTITSLGRVATPLALIVLGGRFEFKAVKELWKQISIAVGLRLVIAPLLGLLIAYFINMRTSTEFAILISLFASPIAVSSAPMAAQMGQDEELAGQIVVWTSALSALSLFVIIMICASIGVFTL
ncbi:MAG: AEC family transporter [Anaeroplasmataceae bacterium]|nr:AEC family transporter [Anaeroplasmataceae bacterium]